MKLIMTLWLALSFVGLNAQNSISTFTVKGAAQISVKPTRTVISLKIKSIDSTYAKSIEGLVGRIDLLINLLQGIGFESDEIITSNFSIEKQHNYAKSETDKSLYGATQILSIQFEQDKDRIRKVLTSVVHSTADPEISFALDNKRKRELRKELIKLAVRDAKTKAEIIADESVF